MDREAAIDNLAAEIKLVMIATDRSYLKRKMDKPQSSSVPEIILAVSDTLPSEAPPSPQPPMSPLFPPLEGSPIIRSTTVQAPDNHQQKLPPRAPPVVTPSATPPAVRHQPPANGPASWLLVSPTAAPQTKAPPQQQPATWLPTQRVDAPGTSLLQTTPTRPAPQ